MLYNVHLRYFRPSGTETSVDMLVEALSMKSAVRIAKQDIVASPARRVNSWGQCSARPATPPVPAIVPKPTPQPIRAGERITVHMPFTGVVEHVADDKVELIGEVYPNGARARRRMPRALLEQLTGRPLEPRPPVVTIEYHAIYPTGAHYESYRPVLHSEYGVENLIQVRVTKHDGKIVKKEIV